MGEKIAIVGSRQGADLEDVAHFVSKLPTDTILVSGGADGVDKTAEQTWLGLGGEVWSFRPGKIEAGWGIEKWELGPNPRVYQLLNEPTWENFKSAALYRDMLIAEVADRTVAFMRRGGSRGAGFTAEMSENYERPTYRYEAA